MSDLPDSEIRAVVLKQLYAQRKRNSGTNWSEALFPDVSEADFHYTCGRLQEQGLLTGEKFSVPQETGGYRDEFSHVSLTARGAAECASVPGRSIRIETQ